MVAQILCQLDQPFAGQPRGFASRPHSVDQALLSANHLPVFDHSPARNFQVLQGIGHKRLYHAGGDNEIHFAAPPIVATAGLVYRR